MLLKAVRVMERGWEGEKDSKYFPSHQGVHFMHTHMIVCLHRTYTMFIHVLAIGYKIIATTSFNYTVSLNIPPDYSYMHVDNYMWLYV